MAFSPSTHWASRLIPAVTSPSTRWKSSEFPPNTVAQVIRKGYLQDKRIIRYAEVLVAHAPETVERNGGEGVTE